MREPIIFPTDYTNRGTGSIHFDNGTLNTEGLCAGTSELTGTGVIYTNALLSDIDMVFDATHGPNQTYTLNSLPDQNITIHLQQAESAFITGAGYRANGSLTITDGQTLESLYAYLGYHTGASGTATVSGTGSTWASMIMVGDQGTGELNVIDGGTISGGGTIANHAGSNGTINVSGTGSTCSTHEFKIGNFGNGNLNITDGATTSSKSVYLGVEAGATGTATVSGSGSQWLLDTSYDNNELDIGHYGNGELSITNGGYVINNWSNIARHAGSTGTVTVSGESTKWECRRGLLVGKGGDGQLSITDGALVTCGSSHLGYRQNATGTVTISGDNSTLRCVLMDLGKEGTGHLEILDGGMAIIHAGTTIGSDFSASAFGTVMISGAGSTLRSDIIVRGDSTWQLDITDGGVLYGNGALGGQPGSQSVATISGIGSAWNGSITLGTGQLNIIDGATSTGSGAHVRSTTGYVSTVNVSGSGSTWTQESNASGKNGIIYLGDYGTGELNITDGGTVNSTTAFLGTYLGDEEATGIANISGADSTWNVENLQISHSEINITDGGTVNNTTCSIGNRNDTTGIVTVSGTGSSWTSRGSLYVGNPGTGKLTITNGGLVMVGTKLYIDPYNDYDSSINMSKGGMLALAGDADDSLSNFLDLVDGTDAIRWWNGTINDWDSLTTATPDTDYTLEYLTDGNLTDYTLLTVTASGPVPGDANGDGRVDGSDVTILANNWQLGVDDNQTATWAMGDFNHDGRVDGSDVTILANNWQYGATTAAAVPEPATIALLLTGLLALGVTFCRKKPS